MKNKSDIEEDNKRLISKLLNEQECDCNKKNYLFSGEIPEYISKQGCTKVNLYLNNWHEIQSNIDISNEILRVKSGTVKFSSEDYLTSLLYSLMRDYLFIGAVENIISTLEYSNTSLLDFNNINIKLSMSYNVRLFLSELDNSYLKIDDIMNLLEEISFENKHGCLPIIYTNGYLALYSNHLAQRIESLKIKELK